MSNLEVEQINPALELASINAVQKQKTEKEHLTEKQQQDALMFAYFQILESVNVQQHTAQTQAKVLEANAQAQAKLNDEDAQLNFRQLSWNALYKHLTFNNPLSAFKRRPKGDRSLSVTSKALSKFKHAMKYHTQLQITLKKKLTATALHKMTTFNLEVDKERGFFSNALILTQQNAQIGETQLNTTINTEEQSVQIGASLMTMLETLTSQIDSLNP